MSRLSTGGGVACELNEACKACATVHQRDEWMVRGWRMNGWIDDGWMTDGWLNDIWMTND